MTQNETKRIFRQLLNCGVGRRAEGEGAREEVTRGGVTKLVLESVIPFQAMGRHRGFSDAQSFKGSMTLLNEKRAEKRPFNLEEKSTEKIQR